MGSIRAEAREQHFNLYSTEEETIKAFLPGFIVTWARRRKASNTELSVMFLNPEPFISEGFGLEQEVMLVYSPYPSMEPRSIQAVDSFFNDAPAKGRVEKLVYFFVSESQDVLSWFEQYSTQNQDSRLVIPFTASELRAAANDPWFVRNRMNEYIYGRDLFDYRLPLEQDISFFGRSDLVLSLHDSAKRGENRGIFGLRKTGKTSLLYKLIRLVTSEGTGRAFYYDCKLPSLRKLRWNELLGRICEDLIAAFQLKTPLSADEKEVDRSFRQLVLLLPKRVLLIFDEIEYISPLSKDDQHWQKDFVAFWQAFWAVQSQNRRVSTLIAGVNPSVVENDSVDGVQNPLFGIVSHECIKGLSLDETRTMIRTLGKRMGLKFSPAAAEHIQRRYGGHPLLTRIACSILNTQLRERKLSRPIEIDPQTLSADEDQRDSDLSFYCRHVVSELQQFYQDEYDMLELLATGQLVDFIELDRLSNTSKHLISYGLLERSTSKIPTIAIPVVGRYVALESARKAGRRTLLYVVQPSERQQWLERRKTSILHDMRLLERVLAAQKIIPILGATSIPEADRFAQLKVVDRLETFENFINVCNRCFIEAIENFGKSIGKDRYYWNEIKNTFPALWFALQRIKTYRHEQFHIQLTSSATADLLAYLKIDLDGRSVNEVESGYFVLQQCVLDSLLTGIQIETAALI